MRNNLYIPQKLKIGFQNRSGTFTGKLAYIIYYDNEGVLRKEKSWNNWIDKKIDVLEVDNNPISGFVINKDIRRSNYYWGSGRTIIRVHDPRDFEFEITPDNLIGILSHSDVTKCDIQEACIFAWSGTELVLLPVNSEAYQQALEYTQKQSKKISASDLIIGATYEHKKRDYELIYIGYLNTYSFSSQGGIVTSKKQNKKHTFYNTTLKYYENYTPDKLGDVIHEEPVDNIAELIEKVYKSSNYQPVVDFKIKPISKLTNNLTKIVDGTIIRMYHEFNYRNDMDFTTRHNPLMLRFRSCKLSHITKTNYVMLGNFNAINCYSNSMYSNYPDFDVVRQFANKNGGKLTEDQFFKIATEELGYGQIVAVLANGEELEDYTPPYFW